MARLFQEIQIDISPHVTARSLIISYCLGVVLTFLTVTISSWRVSYINIVRAIRDPHRETWLGWPTINVMSDHKLLPYDGVYAGRAFFPGFPATFDCVTNIGTRPTVYENYQRVVESHILDFKADVYGERVELFFYKRLREERIFPTVMDLSAQIGRDVEAARELFARRRLEQEAPAPEL